MMDETSTNLNLPYLQAAQAQKHVTHNAALERLDAVVQLVVQSFAEDTPPLAPDEGQVWAIGASPVNDWVGHPGDLALRSNGGWLFVTPRNGWRAALGAEIRVWSGTAWIAPALPDLQNLPGVGVNTSYDTTNKLAVASAAVLFTNIGTDAQLKVNKAAAGDTASLLFQTGYSGRAEMGTMGDDNFAVKVSPDGSAWSTAFSVSASTGLTTMAQLALTTPLSPAQGGTGVANNAAATLTRSGNHALSVTTTATTSVTLPASGTLATRAGTETFSNKTLTSPVLNGTSTGTAITQSAADTTAGRLLKVGDYGAGAAAGTYLFGRANILGTVSQSGGVPTGAVIERGSNANGDYVRFADGTQYCWKQITGQGPVSTAYGSGYSVAAPIDIGTLPATFISAPERFLGVHCTGAVRSWIEGAGVPTTTAGSTCYLCRLTSSTATDFVVNAFFVGRWF